MGYRLRPTANTGPARRTRQKGSASMHRRFIATVLAAALAVTGFSTAPARAANNDIGKWIAGAATIAIIGAAIADNKKKSKRKRDHGVTRGYNYHHDKGAKQKNRGYGHKQRHRQTRSLPARCHERFRGNRGPVRGFARSCLRNSRFNVNTLPQRCAMRVRDARGHGRDIVYGSRCLNDHGYRMSHR